MTTGPHDLATATPLDDLEQRVHAVLRTYANVHRGSGHHSQVSTQLYEHARQLVLEHLGGDARRDMVVFGTPWSIGRLAATIDPERYRAVSSQEIGLPLGVRALAVERTALTPGVPSLTGGGTARLVGPDWVTWAAAPDRFEAGTPAIVNVAAFARALQLIRRHGPRAFEGHTADAGSAAAILRRDEPDQLSGRPLLEALRRQLIGRGGRVPTAGGDAPFVNLDNAASTPTFEPIWAAVRQAWRQPPPVQRDLVRDARATVADAVGAPPGEYDVVFTANTTEAINLVAESVANAHEGSLPPVVVNSLLEHNSNELPWRSVRGLSLVRLPMDRDGFVDLSDLDAILRAHGGTGEPGANRVTLVAVTGASNVLGTCTDLAAIARIVHRHGARLLVDGAQLVAHRAVSMAQAGIDYLAFSGHKVYAPFGTGALVARKGLLTFDAAEMRRIGASGDENVGGIVALATALGLLRRIGFDVIQEEEQALTARTLRGLAQIPRLRVFGIVDPSSPAFARKGGVIPFDVKGSISHGVARALAARGGIGVRSGCHCAHLTVKRMLAVPPWAERLQRLILMVLRRLELPGVVRVSFGIENTAEDVDALLRVLQGIAGRPSATAAEKAVQPQLAAAGRAAIQAVFGRV